MSQIDPAALSRADSGSAPATATPTATTATATTTKSSTATHKYTKVISVPRIDLEPIYTELKAAIGDGWTEYKEATALFLLGMLR